jgi:regulator of CtrA degradation
LACVGHGRDTGGDGLHDICMTFACMICRVTGETALTPKSRVKFLGQVASVHDLYSQPDPKCVKRNVVLSVVSRRVMNNDFRLKDGLYNQAPPISFGDRFQASDQFDAIFKEGMALVERTASYLDGAGRKDAKGLSPGVTVLYATESMRLTTRLLDVASWLLIRRAVKQGELDEAEARLKRQSVKLQALGRPSHTTGFDELPGGLRSLIADSFAMLDRIVQLDRAMTPGAAQDIHLTPTNPVGAQLMQLNKAFKPRLV